MDTNQERGEETNTAVSEGDSSRTLQGHLAGPSISGKSRPPGQLSRPPSGSSATACPRSHAAPTVGTGSELLLGCSLNLSCCKTGCSLPRTQFMYFIDKMIRGCGNRPRLSSEEPNNGAHERTEPMSGRGNLPPGTGILKGQGGSQEDPTLTVGWGERKEISSTEQNHLYEKQ